MEDFPFTEAEWAPVRSVVGSIVHAQRADDQLRVASLHREVIELMASLRERYGDHPVLLETMADYTADDAEAVALYRRAVGVAEAHGLPTLSIRMFSAFRLLCLGQPWAALEELRVCGAEALDGTAAERADWVERLGWAADYARDDAERVALHRRAAEIAASCGIPTLGIRLTAEPGAAADGGA